MQMTILYNFSRVNYVPKLIKFNYKLLKRGSHDGKYVILYCTKIAHCDLAVYFHYESSGVIKINIKNKDLKSHK
jgi:hypothetical protein